MPPPGSECQCRSNAVPSSRACWPPAPASQTLKAPAVHAQAAPFKLGLLTVKTGPLAQGGIQMEQGMLTFLKETQQHARRPQGRVHLRRHRRQSGRHQDQGAGTGRARQGRRHPRAARRLRAAGDHRLHRAAQTPLISLAARRGHDPAPGQSVLHARRRRPPAQACHPMGDYAAKELKLKRIVTDLAKTSPSATSRWAASSACSRTTAARSSRSCGRRW